MMLASSLDWLVVRLFSCSYWLEHVLPDDKKHIIMSISLHDGVLFKQYLSKTIVHKSKTIQMTLAT